MLAVSGTHLLNLVVLAGDEAHPWWDIPGLEFWKFLNLIIFVAVMVYLVRKPLTNALAARREGIRQDLARAKAERDEALAKLAEVDARLAGLDTEVAGIWEKAKAEAEAEGERIKRETEAEMSKLREQTQREIEGAGKVARHELRRFAAQQSVKLAEEIIRRDMRPDDDARLMRLNVEELGRKPS